MMSYCSQNFLKPYILDNIGGRGEIRTHGGRKPTTVFKTVALNRSATLPKAELYQIIPVMEVADQEKYHLHSQKLLNPSFSWDKVCHQGDHIHVVRLLHESH